MEINIVIQIIGLCIAVITIILAVFEFRRNKRIELQNIVYKFKLECFSTLTGKLDEILNLYDMLIKHMEIEINKKNIEVTDFIDKMKDESEEIIAKHCTEIMKYSVAFPESIVKECADFINNQYGDYGLSEYLDIELKNFKKFYREQLEHGDKIYNLIREDLGLEKINKRLYDRS